MRKITTIGITLGALALGALALNPIAAQTSTSEANKAAVEKFSEAFFNKNQADALDAISTADAIHHSPVGDLTVEVWKMVRAGYGVAMPDFTITIEDLIGEGDWVDVRYSLTGTFTGKLMMPDGSAVPGNNAPITMTILSQYHFNEDGKFMESWESFDNLALLTMMGVLPAPGGK